MKIKSAHLWFLLMAGPTLLGFLIFTLWPMLDSFYLSLTKYDVISPPQYVGLENYHYLLTQDPAFWPSVKVTAVYSLVSVPLSILISLGIAMLLNMRVGLIGIYRTIYFLPSLVPATASGIIWVWIFNPNNGLLNRALALVGVQGPSWTQSTAWALPSLIIMSLWGFGGGMIVFLAGLQDVPRSLMEAAELDGAGRWRRFWNVTLPMISPVMFFNLVMGIIGAMKVFDQAYVFGSVAGVGAGGPARATLFYVLNLYQKSFNFFHMGLGSAMAWLLFVVIVLLTALNFFLAKKWVHMGGE